ncbi:MAG: His/Gly/Thr/Pro-type tRNA ligase C-terminal domain-containing protein, partial [Planctomycetota bacterium]
FKFNDWELRGVPLRVEIGPRDVRNEQVVLARRDMPGREGKTDAPLSDLPQRAARMLDAIQDSLFERAVAFRRERTVEADGYEQFRDAVAGGFALARWCGSVECEAKVKEETTATLRCIPFEQPGGEGPCVVCGERAAEQAVWARAY